MRIMRYGIYGQVYLLPSIKITHARKLNGYYEIIFGWFNREIAFGIKVKQK